MSKGKIMMIPEIFLIAITQPRPGTDLEVLLPNIDMQDPTYGIVRATAPFYLHPVDVLERDPRKVRELWGAVVGPIIGLQIEFDWLANGGDRRRLIKYPLDMRATAARCWRTLFPGVHPNAYDFFGSPLALKVEQVATVTFLVQKWISKYPEKQI